MKWFDGVADRYRVAELRQSQDAIETWFSSPFANGILEAQRRCCETHLSSLSGYRLAHLGVSPGHDLVDCFALRHCFKLTAKEAEHHASPEVAGIVDFEALPLPSEAIDIVVLHHVLDFSPRPHEVLNEAARAVTAGGHLVIVAFNPLTLFGLAKWPGVLLNTNPIWRYHSLRLSRLADWLTLLGFELVQHHRGYSEPVALRDFAGRARGLVDVQGKAFYMLVARKRVAPLTPASSSSWLPVRMPVLAGNGQGSSAASHSGQTLQTMDAGTVGLDDGSR